MSAPTAPVPPQNIEAEESVLGAMMLAPGAVDACSEILRSSDFYRESHARIFRAALALYGRGDAVDAITLVDELEKRGELDQVGTKGQSGRDRIHELAALVPATTNAPHYARLVREMAQLRALIRVGAELQRLGYERPGDTENLVDRAQQLAYDLTSAGETSGVEQIGGPTSAAFERMVELQERGSDIIGTPTGFRDLDRMTAGLEPGNLVVMAARPSMGKSSLALAVAANVAIRQGLPAVVFTLEMSKQEVVQRLLAREARVDLGKIRAPARRISSDEWARLAKAADSLQKAPLYVDEKRGLTLVELRSKLRRLKSRQPELGLVVVDYLGLMHVPGVKPDNLTAITTIVSNGLKVLAGDFQVPLIAVSQLNRNVEARISDKRPQLSDLRQSGSIEQDADLVMLLYRDDYYNPETERPGVTEINLAKHRNGATGGVELYFDKPYSTFTELAR